MFLYLVTKLVKLVPTMAYHRRTNGKKKDTSRRRHDFANKYTSIKTTGMGFFNHWPTLITLKKHRSASTTPVSLSLTKELSSLANIIPASAIPSNANKKKSAKLLKQRLLKSVWPKKIWTTSSAEMAEDHYKKHYVKSVRVAPKYSIGDYGFVDFSTGHTSIADKLAQEAFKKLQLRKNWPFNVTSIQLHTIALHEEDIKDTIFIDKLSPARPKARSTNQHRQLSTDP